MTHDDTWHQCSHHGTIATITTAGAQVMSPRGVLLPLRLEPGDCSKLTQKFLTFSPLKFMSCLCTMQCGLNGFKGRPLEDEMCE